MSDGTANVVETAVFVLLGVYWIAIAVFSPKVVGTRWVWILPFVLSIDNISYGLIDHAWSHSVAVQAFQQFLATSVLAGVGLLASAAVMGVIPGLKQRSTGFIVGLVGAALIVAAPILLAVG